MESQEIIARLERQNYLMEKRYEILKSMICDIYDEVIPQKKVCPICKSEIRCYIPYGTPKLRYHAQCPVCLGVERERLLARYLELHWENLAARKISRGEPVKLLHFAPEGVFYQHFKDNKNIDYYPVDFNPDFPYHIVKAVDITDIPYPNDYFDLIICFHVLQNVTDEKKALKEVKRVLGPNGSAIFCDNINQELEATLEDEKYDTSELREQYYGNGQYVRGYGRDYIDRLGSVWGRNNIVKYSVDELSAEEVKKNYLRRGKKSAFIRNRWNHNRGDLMKNE